MTIIDKVKNPQYENWVVDFVTIIFQDRVNEQNLNIVEIEEDKRIIVESANNGQRYVIRTWDRRPCRKDESGKVLSDAVYFSLFKMIKEADGSSHGEEIYSAAFEIDLNVDNN